MFYQLKGILSDKYGVPSFVEVNDDRVEMDFYDERISDNQFFNSNSPVFLRLVAATGRSNTLRDYHRWELGVPNCYHIICSPFFKSILEQMHLPPHRFYPAQIEAENRFYPYFVLHFIFDWLKEIDFSESRFRIVDLQQKDLLIRQLHTGEITSEAAYRQMLKKLTTQLHYLFPDILVFKHKLYDVFGLRGQVIISQRAKDAFTQARITGLALPPLSETDMFSYLEIVRGGEVEVV